MVKDPQPLASQHRGRDGAEMLDPGRTGHRLQDPDPLFDNGAAGAPMLQQTLYTFTQRFDLRFEQTRLDFRQQSMRYH